MKKTHNCGTINSLDVLHGIRKEFPAQKEKAHSSPKGKRGYDRRRDKRNLARDQD